ncbi:hypothetical protein RUM44_002469 [Polyplax serrata]|uniref:EF-hand domain-containing protein n=1 Tax=Polyplax serrata TaxID=468196 RepID=A0ABR1AGE3_POLSC
MLVLHPVGGAMFLKSLGMLLEEGRRGSMPQAHTLLHKLRRKKPGKKVRAQVEPERRNLDIYHLSPSDILWSRRLRQSQRDPLMAVEEQKKLPGKSQPKIIENLKKKTHFSRQEIDSLCKIYKSLVTTSSHAVSKAATSTIGATQGISAVASKIEGLDRVVFRELVHNAFDLVTEEILIDRIFCAFDKNNDGVIRLDNWICGLSTFLRGTLEERAAFCFLVYDMNADGFLTRDEMMHLLRNCLMKSPQDEDPEEGVRDLVDLLMRKMDIDKDGKISYQDFLQAATAEPLLLEAFGQCLPTDSACQTFMSTLRN